MPKELSEDTLKALEEQGGITDDKSKDTDDKGGDKSDKGDLPDITLGDQDDTKDKNKTDDDSASKDGDAGTDGDAAGGDDGDKKVVKTLEDAGYTTADLTARLQKDGGISDEFVAELKEKIDPDLVDAHVGRLRAEYKLAMETAKQNQSDEMKKRNEATKAMNDFIYDSVGGEDKFKILGKTLKAELSADELAAINAKLASGNKTVVKEGLEAAVKKYNNIRGMGGKLMEGDAGKGGDPKLHITKEEYRAIIKTDKYKTDPVYARKMDDARLVTRSEDSQRYGHGAYYGYHPDKGRYAL